MLKRLRTRKDQRRTFRTARRFSRRLLRASLKVRRPQIYNRLDKLEITCPTAPTLSTNRLKLNQTHSHIPGNTLLDFGLAAKAEHSVEVGFSDTGLSSNHRKYKIQSSARRSLLSLAASSGHRSPKQLFRSVRAPQVRRVAQPRTASLKHLKGMGTSFRPVSTATAGYIASRDS